MAAARAIGSVLLALVAAWPAKATAAPSVVLALAGPAIERRGHLEVDATALTGSTDLIVAQISEMAKVVFEREGVRITNDPGDPILKVVIAPLDPATAGYRITYHVERGGKHVDGSRGTSDCRLCTEGELVDATVAGIELVAQHMEVQAEPASAAEPPPSDAALSDPGAEPGTSPGEPPADRVRLGAMGKAGIALIVVGAAGLGTGIGLVVRKPTPLDSPNAHELLDTRRPGYGVLAAGAAVAIGGAIMLALDIRRSKTAARTSAIVPLLLPRAAGVGLSGWF